MESLEQLELFLNPNGFIELMMALMTLGVMIIGLGFLFNSRAVKKVGGNLVLVCFILAFFLAVLLDSGVSVPPWGYGIVLGIIALKFTQIAIILIFGKDVATMVVSGLIVQVFKVIISIIYGPIELAMKLFNKD